MPVVSLSNQNDVRSVLRQKKIPREQNQKDANSTSKTSNSIRDILLFRRSHLTGNLHPRLSTNSNDSFSKKIRIEGGGEYWSCGQDHDPRNWNWKPWQHLEGLCRKRGLDDFAVRDILIEHSGRKLECECQVLFDERELRKMALRRQFGVDFDSGEVGLVDWDRNCRTVFNWNAKWNLEFWG